MSYIKCPRIYEKLSLPIARHWQYGRILHPLRAMSGYAGLPSSRKTRREKSMLKEQSVSSRKGCAGRVAGWVVFIARISR